MAVCPKCGYEYEPSVRECADCGVRLVEPKKPRAAMDRPLEIDPALATQELVSVYVAFDELALERVHSALCAQGIRAAKRPFYNAMTDRRPLPSAWSLSHPLGAWGEVLVLEQDAARAAEIVDVLETGRIVTGDMPEAEERG